MSYSQTEDQWPSYFNHQNSYPESGFTNINTYDSHMMTTDSVITTSSSDVVMSPTNSSSPGNRAAPKPIRRRSRASKKTPTTLLNADASNFRALVQQFTGRPSVPSVITPGVQRGPVNINFGQGSYSGEVNGSGSGSGFVSYGPGYDHQGYGGNPQYGYGRVNPNNPNFESPDIFVGDGLQNLDDLDWGTISSSSYHP